MAQVRNSKALRATRRTRATRPARRGRGSRWTQLFAEGNAKMRDLLGGKGAGLAEMSRIGLPVPPGFTITTEACLEYYRRDKQLPPGLLDEVRQRVRAVETRTGKRFGDPSNPLLVSVRSGAKFSMRSEEHTSELQSLAYLVCRLLLEKKKKTKLNWRDR